MNLRKRKVNEKTEPVPSVSAAGAESRQAKLPKKEEPVERSPEVKAAKTEVADDKSVTSFKIEEFLSDPDWKEALKDEFEKDYFKEMNKILATSYSEGLARPVKEKVFNVFNSTKLSEVKVVILGQDPYHDENQADGLCFSIPKEVDLPRSLKNIFQELKDDIPSFERDESLGGCLQSWTKQGVFLLNTILTVELHKPASHARIGWQIFTDRVIQLISEKSNGCAFILWGLFAHKKESLIDGAKHKIIKTPHPSPLSQGKFFGCKCFSKANDFLVSVAKEPVNWSLKS